MGKNNLEKLRIAHDYKIEAKIRDDHEKSHFIKALMELMAQPYVDYERLRLAQLIARIKGWDIDEFTKIKTRAEEKSANIKQKKSAELLEIRQKTRRLGRAGAPRNEPEYDFTGSADDQGNGTTGGEG